MDTVNIDNRERFISLLRSTGRVGVGEVLVKLAEWGFFTAPASVGFHNNIEGGLLKHSLDVYDEALKVAGEESAEDASTILSSLLHDVCKCDNYCMREGRPHHKAPKFPLGHGEKSVIMLLMWGLELTTEEVMAIRWHMGRSVIEKGSAEEKEYEEALHHQLCRRIVNADYNASHKYDNNNHRTKVKH